MTSAPADSLPGAAAGARTATRKQIRGSSLLLAGRLLSKGANFAVQVLIVRHLSRGDFGAFAYALSVVMVCQTIVTFGLDRAVTRFVPIYQEHGDYRKMVGTVCMVLGSLVVLGIAMVLTVHGLEAYFGSSLVADAQARALLLILVFLAPVEAIDAVLVGLFAVFSSPKAIFFRRYVLAPAIKLGVVLALIVGGYGIHFLALGYLAGGLVGVLFCVVMLYRVLRQEGLLARIRPGEIEVPWRPVLAFTLPLLTSDLLYAVMHLTDTVMLGHFRDTLAVGSFRAVWPMAHMNAMVFASFGTLFTPAAARLFARRDSEGIHHLYWQTAIWIAVLSFPIFAVTFSLAEPATVLVFGEQYRESSTILAVLALGYYFNAALGMNGLTLKVYGRVGYVAVLNLLTVAIAIGANLLLIPPYGALGAAIGTTLTLIVHNILKQAGIHWFTGVHLFESRYVLVYVSIVLSAAALLVLQWAIPAPAWVDLALAGLVSLGVLRLNRHRLAVKETLPEILKLPGAARLLGT
jgi:O-antigen/teichoic acid export membrane protein